MKVPKKIQETIIKCANYNNKAKYYEQIIFDWLTKNKLTQETCEDITRDMQDGFMDYCQQEVIRNYPELQNEVKRRLLEC